MKDGTEAHPTPGTEFDLEGDGADLRLSPLHFCGTLRHGFNVTAPGQQIAVVTSSVSYAVARCSKNFHFPCPRRLRPRCQFPISQLDLTKETTTPENSTTGKDVSQSLHVGSQHAPKISISHVSVDTQQTVKPENTSRGKDFKPRLISHLKEGDAVETTTTGPQTRNHPEKLPQAPLVPSTKQHQNAPDEGEDSPQQQQPEREESRGRCSASTTQRRHQ